LSNVNTDSNQSADRYHDTDANCSYINSRADFNPWRTNRDGDSYY